MAVATDSAVSPNPVTNFTQTSLGRNVILMVVLAVIVSILAAVWMWTQQPDYRVLFSNFSDRDGGAIVASLQQQNIPYKFSDGGSAILVPAEFVYDARLKLAAQGLPKGGNVGFELMENEKLGVSQFAEQVNYQRALEGELARSIQSISSVQAARVHLALPKASVFVRDQQKPTASVLLNLYPGRTLDEEQTSAIVHLVASSVPELSAKSVTVVDQNGNLLSESSKPSGTNTLDPTQLKYVQDLQQSIAKRIESIITPIVGLNNVRAEATADVDFSHTEQAAELYKPNRAEPAVRSEQMSESRSNDGAGASGVPGALTNQPPAPATAPLTTPPAGQNANTASATTGNMHKDSTVNYEVDKTIRYVQQPMGGIKRLSVAVVVNYKSETAKDGKVTFKPLTEQEKNQITDLVKEAMGYSKDRGDTLNVVNTPFAGPDKEVIQETPFWKRSETMVMAKEIAKYLIGSALVLYIFFAWLKPVFNRIAADLRKPPPFYPEQEDVVSLSSEESVERARTYQENLDAAKQLARQDPKMVANVVKSWVGTGNE
jgi:flagellar M-ring protein FliF